MNATQRICRWHRRLLQLYPDSFKTEFGEELALVFEQAAGEAAQHGRWPLLRLFLHELGDLPWNILNQVWQNREVNAMFERFLSGGKNSRYRRAGAIGLMISFLISTIILWLPEQIPLLGQFDFIPRMLVALLAGLVGGAIWGAGWQPRRILRGALTLGAGMLLGRLAAYPLNRAIENLTNLWQSILFLLIVSLMGIIVSLVCAAGMGMLDSPERGRRLVGFGALGFVLGRLAYDVLNIGYTLGVFLLAGNTIPEFNPWLAYGFGVLGSALQGYISGSWLGSACQPTGSLEPRQVTA